MVEAGCVTYGTNWFLGDLQGTAYYAGLLLAPAEWFGF